MAEAPDVQRDALNALVEINSSVIVEALLNASHPMKDKVARLLRLAPEFTLESLSTPEMLVNLGIWAAAPRGWDDLQEMPRYFAGRPILVKTKVVTVVSSPNFMKYSSGSQDKFITHNATLVGMDAERQSFLIEVEGKEDGPILAPVAEILEYN